MINYPYGKETESKMMQNNRLFLLNKAKFLTMEGKYKKALKFIDKLLITNPNDVDALRLKGNVLSVKITDENYSFCEKKRKLVLCSIQKCHERILKFDPNNMLALIDLGDYWRNESCFDKSLQYYNKAISLLKEGHFYLSLEDELIEAFYGKKELLKNINEKSELLKCQEEETILSKKAR